MSLEKLAKLVDVDEVLLAHGPKGMSITVRIDKSWLATTIEKAELEDTHHPTQLIGRHLSDLSDNLHKALGITRSRTRDHVTEAQQSVMSRYPAMRDMWGGDVREAAYQPVERQAFRPQRVELPPPAAPEPEQPNYEPSVSAPMGSRFEAIVRELDKL